MQLMVLKKALNIEVTVNDRYDPLFFKSQYHAKHLCLVGRLKCLDMQHDTNWFP